MLITLIKAAANSLGIGARQVDVIVDRSDQLGVGPTKRRLPGQTFEVLGPGQFNTGPGGRLAQMVCAATFRIIADSDQGPFRDLLLLPAFYGYLRLRKQPPQTLIEQLKKEPVVFAPLDLQSVRAHLSPP